MADDSGGRGLSPAIVVALLTLVGVLATATFNNWDKLFPRAAPAVATAGAGPGAAMPATGGTAAAGPAAGGTAAAGPAAGGTAAAGPAAGGTAAAGPAAGGTAAAGPAAGGTAVADAAPASPPGPAIDGRGWRDQYGGGFVLRTAGGGLAFSGRAGAKLMTGVGSVTGTALHATITNSADDGTTTCDGQVISATQIDATCRDGGGDPYPWHLARPAA